MPQLSHNSLLLIILLPFIFYGCNTQSSKTENNVMNKINTQFAFVGNYTEPAPSKTGSKGIYGIKTNSETGEIIRGHLLAEVDNPNFLTFSPDRKFLYASGDSHDDREITGQVYAFKINADTTLTFLNKQSSLGNSACHVSLDQTGQFVFTANYSSGVAAVYNRNEDGSLTEPLHKFEFSGSGPHPNQNSAHPHQAMISPNNKFLYIPDLGTDQIHVFRILHDDNKVVPTDFRDISLPPGSGPRHMTFHPSLPYAYVINELGNTIQAFEYNSETGFLEKIELYSTLPDEFEEVSYCADIHIHPDGELLFGSNRGHNSLVGFRINKEDGSLDLIDHFSVQGDWPRNFAIDPSGKFVYVANQNSGNISVFDLDPVTGKLSLIDSTFNATLEPVCLLFY